MLDRCYPILLAVLLPYQHSHFSISCCYDNSGPIYDTNHPEVGPCGHFIVLLLVVGSHGSMVDKGD